LNSRNKEILEFQRHLRRAIWGGHYSLIFLCVLIFCKVISLLVEPGVRHLLFTWVPGVGLSPGSRTTILVFQMAGFRTLFSLTLGYRLSSALTRSSLSRDMVLAPKGKRFLTQGVSVYVGWIALVACCFDFGCHYIWAWAKGYTAEHGYIGPLSGVLIAAGISYGFLYIQASIVFLAFHVTGPRLIGWLLGSVAALFTIWISFPYFRLGESISRFFLPLSVWLFDLVAILLLALMVIPVSWAVYRVVRTRTERCL